MDIAQKDNPYLAGIDGNFAVAAVSTSPKSAPDEEKLKKKLSKRRKKLDEQQRRLYAEKKTAVLLVFQAMDAAGKDSTIRAVFRRVDPNGCHVWPFKQPTEQELAHDFLWRTSQKLPKKGKIGIFNRSYYEEVLVVRVHQEYLAAQNLPPLPIEDLWPQRFRSICDHERHLAESGTLIMKFWLNVGRDEQARRFLSRIDDKEKRFKFAESDVKERRLWEDYMLAYEDMINQTSKPWAPWYVIPADNKPYMRLQVANIVLKSLYALKPRYPEVPDMHEKTLAKLRAELVSDLAP